MIYMATVNKVTRSTRDIPTNVSGRIDVSSVNADTEARNQQLSMQVTHLQQDLTKLQNSMADQSKTGKAINQDLQELKLFAGLTDVEGPGIIVTLRDSTKQMPEGISEESKIIHDIDVLRVVNELWASGAEAVAVNRHRISVGSSVRCVGPTVLVDGTRIASPYVIRAIGDADTLEGGLNIPGGLAEEFRDLDPAMIEIAKVKKQLLPAFTGSTQHTLLTVPKEVK
jgi:uncharacterized protein YlxW (UPF0749 family)